MPKPKKSEAKHRGKKGPPKLKRWTARELVGRGAIVSGVVGITLVAATMLSSGPVATKFNLSNGGLKFDIAKTTPVLPDTQSRGTRAIFGMQGNISDVTMTGNKVVGSVPLLDARGNVSEFNLSGNSVQVP